MSFCMYCGKQLADGEVCACRNPAPAPAYQQPTYQQPAPTYQQPTYQPPAPTYQQPTYQQPAPAYQQPAEEVKPNPAPALNKEAAAGFWESMKNRMGIGDPELNKGDAYEKGKKIIPDCVDANEGEIPVKQYKVALLRNRILGIPYAKAVGRMQVTNKRVIFRAPGRCIAGRTTLQHEFAIDELAGLEARREYAFSGMDLLIGIIVALFGGFVISSLISAIAGDSYRETAGLIILTLLFGTAGVVPFFILKKKWLLKLLCLGGSYIPLLVNGSALSTYSNFNDSGADAFFGGLFIFMGILALIVSLFGLFLHAIKPNLVLLIKNKGALETVDIKRRRLVRFGAQEDHTGYTEVIPMEDTERCIREINAMINDIQKLGDFGIEKWKEE